MNIIVTHEGKQYVNRLLTGLDRQGWLSRFLTSFSGNRYLNRFSWFPAVQHQLRKRVFSGFNESKIRTYPISFIVEKICRTEFNRYRLGARLFDIWASNQLKETTDFDLIISYENSNLFTFSKAKQLRKITLLDLAQIHHNTIASIRQQVRIDDFTPSQLAYLNTRKQAALKLTDYILTLSGFATQSLVENGIDRSRIYEVNLGVDIQRFNIVPKLKDSRFRILFVGTITYRKGVDLLLKTFHSLNLNDAELTLIGPVSDGQDLLTQCTGAVKYVPFLHHEELVRYYQQADVFVFPSHLDSWGQVVLEAMACGTPVIVSENTGAKDAVAKGGGFIIPTGDEVALREKIRYVYDHPEERELLGREARRVAEQYTWENYYEQVRNALTDIAHREGIPV